MEESSQKKKKRNKIFSDVKIFQVPFPLIENQGNHIININTPSKPSKEQIINQAIRFHVEGNISEAGKYYEYCINNNFHDPIIFSNYGSILKGLGKLKDAELYTRKAIEIKPNYPEALSNLGNILNDLGKSKEAELYTRKAIEIKPNYPEALSNLGNILNDLGKLKDAEVYTRKAIDIEPNYAEALSNLGNILNGLGKSKEAEVYTCKAIEIKPNYANAYNNLGAILKDLGKLKEAEIATRKAIELNPNFANANLNLGSILKALGRIVEAEYSTRQAIKINPDLHDAYFSLSNLELLMGNYKSGLEHYEFRFKKKKPTIIHGESTLKPVGNHKLNKGEKVLVISEQGLGDTLHYMRYIPYLRNQGFDISFCAQTKLHSLIRSSGIDQNPLTPEQANTVSEGKWIPLLSIPRILHVGPENPIISEPYINSSDQLKKKWQKLLSEERQVIIGINWQGNPEMEKTYQGRSIPLELFGILLKTNNIKFLSLQKGYGSEQLQKCSFRKHFVTCQDEIDNTFDFEETAAIIENCDLVISNDTCAATMTGGIGKKVWLLLKDVPYWTWGLQGNETFWYPSMRLFRQKERHNWSEVMERVSIELQKIKKNNSNSQFKNTYF